MREDIYAGQCLGQWPASQPSENARFCVYSEKHTSITETLLLYGNTCLTEIRSVTSRHYYYVSPKSIAYQQPAHP